MPAMMQLKMLGAHHNQVERDYIYMLKLGYEWKSNIN